MIRKSILRSDESDPGFKHFLLQPNFVKGLQQFKSSFNSVYGTIISNWEWEDNSILYFCEVPPNSSATLTFKGKSAIVKDKLMEATSEGVITIPLAPGSYSIRINVN